MVGWLWQPGVLSRGLERRLEERDWTGFWVSSEAIWTSWTPFSLGRALTLEMVCLFETGPVISASVFLLVNRWPWESAEELISFKKHGGPRPLKLYPVEAVASMAGGTHSSADLQEGSALLQVNSWAAALVSCQRSSFWPTYMILHMHSLFLGAVSIYFRFYLVMGEKRCRQLKSFCNP